MKFLFLLIFSCFSCFTFAAQKLPSPQNIVIHLHKNHQAKEIAIEQLFADYFWHWRFMNCEKLTAHPVITKGTSFDQLYVTVNGEQYPLFLGSARVADTELGLEYFFNTLVFKNKQSCLDGEPAGQLQSIRVSFCENYETGKDSQGKKFKKCPYWPDMDTMKSIEWNIETKKASLYKIEKYQLINIGNGYY